MSKLMMMMVVLLGMVVLSLGCSQGASMDDGEAAILAGADELLQNSIERLLSESGERCTHVITRTENEHPSRFCPYMMGTCLGPRDNEDLIVATMRYQPTEPHWVLLTIGGRPPTVDVLERFAPHALDNYIAMIEKNIRTEYIRATTENGQAEYTFRPIDEEGEPLNEAVQGSLTIDVENAIITRLVMHAEEPFYPSYFIKPYIVNPFFRYGKFSHEVEFAYDDKVGHVVIRRMVSHVYYAKAPPKRTVNIEFEMEFSDYDCG